jgi:hypothetical protein
MHQDTIGEENKLFPVNMATEPTFNVVEKKGAEDWRPTTPTILTANHTLTCDEFLTRYPKCHGKKISQRRKNSGG